MQHKAGFLLIEIVVVVALLITIITLAMPPMTFLYKQIVYSEVEKLASVCLFLRQLALATHREQLLTFNQAAGTYSTHENSYMLSGGVQFGFLPQSYGPPSNPQSLINQAITYKSGKIIFHPDGTISSGTIYLIDAGRNYCYALTTPSAQLPCIRRYEYRQRWVLLS